MLYTIWSLLPFSALFTLVQPYAPPFQSLKMSQMASSQGLCTYRRLCLECSLFFWQPQVLLHHFSKGLKPSLTTLYKIAPFIPSSSSLPWIIFIYSSYPLRTQHVFICFIVCLSPQRCTLPKGESRTVLPPLYSQCPEKCLPCHGHLITHQLIE